MPQPQPTQSVEEVVTEVLALLQSAADTDYIGEDVSQLEHALQCAALACQANATEPEIIAALLHDVGHFCGDESLPQMAGWGTVSHEAVGARFLDGLGFSQEVQALIHGHVEAKRYLVGKHPHYAARMSEASTQTLAHQGGPMTPEEQAAFAQDPLYKAKLRLRQWDDGGKDTDSTVHPLPFYEPMLQRHLQSERNTPMLGAFDLTETQRQSWQAQGYLHLTNVFTPAQIQALQDWAEVLTAWPETPGKWMKYFEGTATNPRQLCRVENFLPYHDGWSQLLCGEEILDLLSALMDEKAVLFKEKMNLKLPGGAGFGAHQDAPAFTTFGQTYHITLMLSIDEATPANGCLEVVPGRHKEGLLAQAPDGTLAPEEIDAMTWEPVPTKAGDLLLFDSYIPHRSLENTSESPRRALYVTYNRASEGAHRDAYFAHKRSNFPPECERTPGADYSQAEALYNLGNPIR